MKNHFIGFIVSALLHAGLIGGVVALNNQPEKKLIPKNNVILMVKMFQSEVLSHHSAPTIINTDSNYIPPNHSITPAPVIKKQPLKKQVQLDKKPQAIFINNDSKPQTIKKNIKKKIQTKKKVRVKETKEHHIVKVLKKRASKKKVKKKKIKQISQKIVIKKKIKRLVKKKNSHPSAKKVLVAKKSKIIKNNIKPAKRYVAKKTVKRSIKRNTKPAKHYAAKKIVRKTIKRNTKPAKHYAAKKIVRKTIKRNTKPAKHYAARKIVRKTIKRNTKPVKHYAARKIVRKTIKRNTKPTKHYAARKIKPIKQRVITRRAPIPYYKTHGNALKKKHAIVAKRPVKVYPKAYNNKLRGKSIAKKQLKTGSVKTKVRVNKKHIVAKRNTNNRSSNPSVPQYHKKANPKKVISKNVRHLNPSYKAHLQQKPLTSQYHKKASPKKTLSKNTQQLNQQYKARLQQIIVSKKSYPRRARRHGQQGKVTLSFSVSHSGTITDIRVLKSSGIAVLDKASIQAIQQSSKILQFFPKMPKKSMKLSITLNYILNS